MDFTERVDGNCRRIVRDPAKQDYKISTGGPEVNQFIFELKWHMSAADLRQELEKRSEIAKEQIHNPRWDRSVEDGRGDQPARYDPLVHKSGVGSIREYINLIPIGKGGFGEGFKTIDVDLGGLIAVKRIALRNETGVVVPEQELQIWREVDALSKVSHKTTVEYLGYSDTCTKYAAIYMSLKPGSFHDLLEISQSIRANRDILNLLLREMLEALDYLASGCWIHRDVKPQNILYTHFGGDKYRFQLADLGIAIQQEDAKSMPLCGTKLYMPPEVQQSAKYQSPKMDVWALFVVMGNVMKLESLHDPSLAAQDHQTIVSPVRAAARGGLSEIKCMAREGPNRCASAAQMLRDLFNGEGMSTPPDQVGPTPH